MDPYYLIDKADTVGIDARLLKTARSVNNNMAIDYAHRIADKLRRSGGTSVLLLGFAFKPNCDDIRNTRVADVYNELKKTVSDITICDPLIDVEKAKENYGITVVHSLPSNKSHTTSSHAMPSSISSTSPSCTCARRPRNRPTRHDLISYSNYSAGSTVGAGFIPALTPLSVIISFPPAAYF